MRSIRDLALQHKMVFLRVDFNVPLDDDGAITDDARIKAALNTIEYVIQKGGKLVIASHLGRPKEKGDETTSLRPVAERLSQLLGKQIQFAQDCIGESVELKKASLQPGDVLLLENLRYYNQEKENDLHFAEQLALGIDVYINDAFGVVHRKHASTAALPSLIFDKGIGFLIQNELESLERIVNNPKKPFVVVIGGIKISDKVDVIRSLAPMSDAVLIGGGVANTFVSGLGSPVGASIVESDSVGAGQNAVNYTHLAKEIYEEFSQEGTELHTTLPDGMALKRIQLPLDFVAAPNTDPGAPTKVIEVGDEVPEGWMFLDIGPKTQQLYKEVLGEANTIFWNGPMGLFEMNEYSAGSHTVAQAIADSKGYAVLGGGDTEVVTEKFGLKGKYSHASTGGGASLAFLAQKPLPGLKSLE